MFGISILHMVWIAVCAVAGGLAAHWFAIEPFFGNDPGLFTDASITIVGVITGGLFGLVPTLEILLSAFDWFDD